MTGTAKAVTQRNIVSNTHTHKEKKKKEKERIKKKNLAYFGGEYL